MNLYDFYIIDFRKYQRFSYKITKSFTNNDNNKIKYMCIPEKKL